MFLQQRRFWPLVGASVIALAMMVLSVILSGSPRYAWMQWNLALAWLPYWFSLWVAAQHQRYPQRRWHLIVPALAWLLFLPNAPYMVTDLMHLSWQTTWILWFDTVLLATFAWVGCALAVQSLHIMQAVVADFWGRWISWVFVIISAVLSGFGVYLGRFLRWNSWSVLTAPEHLVRDLLLVFQHPEVMQRAVGVSAMFGLLLLVCYLTFPAPVGNHQPPSQAQPRKQAPFLPDQVA